MFEMNKAAGELVVRCNECSYDETFFGRTAHEAWPEARDFGWRAIKQNKQWIHKCPSCVAKWAEQQRMNGNF